MEIEKPAHSFIIDTTDDNIKNLFSETEWDGIMNVNKKTVPAIDKDIGTHLISYKKKTPSEMRAHVMKPWLNTTYNVEDHFDFQYIHMVFSHLLDEYESPKNRLVQPHAEGCVASSNRRNDDEMYTVKGNRKALGHRIDGIVQNLVNNCEYGGIEVAKTCQGLHDRKQLGDSLKLTKLLKDIFHQQSGVVGYNEERVKKLEVVGLLHSRLQLQQFMMDFGGGSCLQLKKETTRNIPLHLGDVMGLIHTIASVLQAKLRIQRYIEVMKNEAEDESFLLEITQPPTPPNTVCLAKTETTPIKNK
ncbi:12189_t:CDS:2 [Acaulospora colombiana]|uniref:12189_t:CDS:1 n=1 Tax=Acaulospora colombiana TaxID=27376 RepID=A0ACA9P1A3_9GLOM|nr:12189_t:CDS:2 [Acaulospora colombiana]